MATQHEMKTLDRLEALYEDIIGFRDAYSPNDAANAAVLNCVEVVKSKAQMFRTLASIAGNEDRFSLNTTLADEMLQLARELQRFVIKFEDVK
jgi:hypothetical protein